MIALLVYLVFLFFLGIGAAVVSYHILRYRDADDASGIILAAYFIVSIGILVGTALLLDYQTLFTPINTIFP